MAEKLENGLVVLAHTEVALIDWGESRSGGPWIKLRLPDPELLDEFRPLDTATMKKTGHILHMTLAMGDIAQAAVEEEHREKKGPYGEYARALVASGFFRVPAVWELAGTDDEYIRWIQTLPSCLSGEFSSHVDGEGRCIAAHVRRAGESGTGYKAPYACVPLTDAEHTQLQHQHGERACLVHHGLIPNDASVEDAKEWFDRARIKYVSTWAKRQITRQRDVESLTNVDPRAFKADMIELGLERYLPRIYDEL